MRFENLSINGWRQFSAVNIDFHPRITIITGANGAGKSTILRIVSQHFGWTNQLLSTPRLSKEGTLSYFTGILDWFRKNEKENIVGSIRYDNGTIAKLRVPPTGPAQYTLSIEGQQPVEGLIINSHRPSSSYQQVSSIPTNPMRAEQAYQAYYNEVMTRYQNSHTGYSPVYRMKESIISMAMFGPGNSYVQPNADIARLFGEFKGVLSKVLPASIGFRDISVRIPDVVVVTDTGEFMIDAASGGLMSLFDLAWQIFLYSQRRDKFVVAFDEPENHLHPAMQRSLIRKLLDAFPNAQFIVATHSPFIVSSVRESNVFVLRYEDDWVGRSAGEAGRRVSSLKLDQANKAGTASEVLRDVLGVQVTLPEWAEEELRAIAADFTIEAMSPGTIGDLRDRLSRSGLGEYYPDALKIIADRPPND